MKVSTLLPLAALSTAIVIPEESVLNQLTVESQQAANSFLDELQSKLPSKDEVVDFIDDSISTIVDSSQSTLDDAIEWAEESFQAATNDFEEEYFDVQGWLNSANFETADGPPHHGKPGHGKPGHGRPGRGKPGHRRPRHPHVKSNKTVYELIAGSKYTTRLAKLISEDDYLLDLLNGTSANFTVFVPTDKAFAKLPKHGDKPPKEIIRKILKHHVSPDFYPAGRVLASRTIPTLLEGEYLSEDPASTPQRLSTNIGFRGLTVNYFSRVVAVNIFGSNGVIHGVDNILRPPFKAATAISFLPSTFSTLELGLVKTGLYPYVNDTSTHLGGTLFAPSNYAFKKLGPRVNAFLFSKYGQKYLAALLKYHVVANQTLYSDAFYKSSSSSSDITDASIPKGKFHVDLPTLLGDRYLSIDIGRYGRLINIRINGFQSVAIPDGNVKDGVIHVVGNVIIPPKKLANGELAMYSGEEVTVEDLKERLEPLVEQNGDDVEEYDGRLDL